MQLDKLWKDYYKYINSGDTQKANELLVQIRALSRPGNPVGIKRCSSCRARL